MLNNMWFIVAIWIGLAFAASLISIRLGIAVALVEVLIGVIAGNFLGLHETTQWIDFLALMGSLTLTFLAGAEIDPQSFKTNLKSSLIMGILSFALPFIGVWMFAQYFLGWGILQAQIAGIALSTTSVAIVYSVMIEKGLSNTPIGTLILSAVFITDLGTVLLLGALFANFNLLMLLFIVSMAAVFFIIPYLTKTIIKKLGANSISNPEIKFILLVLFLLAWIATAAKSEAVLSSFVMGFAVARVFMNDKAIINRIRTIAFTFFTPFFFIKAGLYISLNAVLVSFGAISLLMLAKVVFKSVGVWSVARAIKLNVKISNYTTLLMSTGLTFGTIATSFGFNNNIIDQNQYSILVTVVILSGVIPTIIAQKFFEPSLDEMNNWGKSKDIR